MRRASSAAAVAIAALLCIGAARAEEDNDLRDLRLGMSVGDIPAEEYVNLACAPAPGAALSGWQEYRKCPADAAGLHAVAFHFNDRTNPLAQVNDKYEGTRVAGHPVLLTLLIDDRGTVEGLRIATDPHAPLFWRKKAYLLSMVVKSRYGEQGWSCRDPGPSDGEAAVGGVFIKQHCEKTTDSRKLSLDEALYRGAGQSISEFVNETRLEIRPADTPHADKKD
jgi:hypothetical protein